jgi:hypothetical protein
MSLSSPASGENMNLSLWKWAEKEKSDTTPNDTLTTFEFSLVADRKIKSLTGLHATNLIPAHLEEDSNGLFEYYEYDGGWDTTKGNLQMADCKVYFRKNGIDTLVSGATAQITSISEGSTNIEVEFAQAPTTAVADSILLSYAYQDVTNPEPSKYCVKDFDFKHNGRDYTETQCIGGVTFKRRQPLGLTEISLTTLKMGNSLLGIMLGERTNVTMNSVATTNVTGGNKVHNWALSLAVTDPDNPTRKLYIVAVNIGGTGVNPKGGADADFEETISFKTNPQDYCEIAY